MDELKEKIARAITLATEIDLKYKEPSDRGWKDYTPEAQAALTAIEEAGYVVVPQAVMASANFIDNPPLSGIEKRALTDEGANNRTLLEEVTAIRAAYARAREINYATMADSATTFDPELQHCKDNDL